MFFRLIVTILIAVPFMAAAEEKATIFPPVTVANTECGSDQLRVLSWASGTTSTICLTGQEVMSLALPSCQAGQQVAYDGSKFLCRTPTAIPTCKSDEYLSFDGSNYSCRPTVTPVCASNQVLTNTGTGVVCVDRTEQMPTCTAQQFLTYNGSSYQCATSQHLSLPTCASGEVLTSDGTQLSCVAVSGTGSASSIIDLYGKVHTSKDCADAAGTVSAIGGGDYICQFSGSACPSGWTRLGSWSSTQGKSYSGTCSYDINTNSGAHTLTSSCSCSVGGHAFANSAQEAATCSGSQCSCGTIRSSVVTVGCY